MVRISALTLLAFAVSALAAPQAPAESGAPEQVLDLAGNPVSAEKAKELQGMDGQLAKVDEQLFGSFSQEQKDLYNAVEKNGEALDGSLDKLYSSFNEEQKNLDKQYGELSTKAERALCPAAGAAAPAGAQVKARFKPARKPVARLRKFH
ncbi:hypothetical protein VFPFJ_04420 [Purpureocillium lilacinum]|uniref:Uncharacterized protein n=2 Tax=Purpureocillium lilacinum TaxID=33203 RepID=A0A179HL24_PURLI|nr:hypothetical protein VFPFJ_04420 [Purpureocillium lilacinum]KAK4095463.1 hypothetical protein Purlil1_259 [Purpureocillium lilacinum]OAQ90261.1 hypothetical protein VFPFJ_04420 [Purpureocillium lilacinum]